MLIVVSQMLTGFDSKWVNTLYIDRMLEYADLIQAFSRTNRLFGPDKPFGTIRYYQRPHTMERNIEIAVREYSGDKPLGLFVSKRHINIEGMNTKFAEISYLFEQVGIQNFARLPEEVELKVDLRYFSVITTLILKRRKFKVLIGINQYIQFLTVEL